MYTYDGQIFCKYFESLYLVFYVMTLYAVWLKAFSTDFNASLLGRVLGYIYDAKIIFRFLLVDLDCVFPQVLMVSPSQSIQNII